MGDKRCRSVKLRRLSHCVAQDVCVTGTGADRPRRLRLLLDSNVVIAVEPFCGVSNGMPVGAELLRLANEQGHLLCVAPATQDDLLQGSDPLRRRQRLAELKKLHPAGSACGVRRRRRQVRADRAPTTPGTCASSPPSTQGQ